MLKMSLGASEMISNRVRMRVCIEMIFTPLSYKINPITSITNARSSEGGVPKKSRYKRSKLTMMKNESTLALL